MKLIPVEPIEIDEEGNIKFNPSSTLLNDDWLGSSRLLIKAKNGDEDAKKELQRRENIKMVYIKED